MGRRKALVRPAAVLVLLAALAGLLLGGVFSETSGKPADQFPVASGGRPPANWASHCADVREGPPPKRHSALLIGVNSLWHNASHPATLAGAGVTMERLEIPVDSVEAQPGKYAVAEFDRDLAIAQPPLIPLLPLV